MPRSLLVACALALASPALGDDCVDSPTFSFDNACEDDADWVKAGKPDNADCAWIADGNSDQCARAEDSSGRTAEEACGCACARPNRGCAWVGEGDTEARCDLVSHITAASACPATCSGSAFADSETWFYKKADRDCAWVAAEKTESRCRKVGEEAAADACPGTCLDDCAGVAESAVTDAPTAELLQRCHNAPAWRLDAQPEELLCEDDDDWVKDGKPDNADCAWVAENTDECGRAKNAAGVKAEAACPCACGPGSTPAPTSALQDLGCGWVSEDPAARCATVSRLEASAACAATCGPDTNAGAEDSSSWVSDDGRDCGWVAAKPETRCKDRFMGEDVASAACPLWCDAECADAFEEGLVTAAPTPEFVLSGVGDCEDDLAWTSKRGGCDWVALKPEYRCRRAKHKVRAVDACFETCDNPAGLEDDPDWYLRRREKTCAWLAEQPAGQIPYLCDKMGSGGSACPGTCGECAAAPACGTYNVKTAVAEYFSDPELALAFYGPIEAWDVACVEDLGTVFEGTGAFNADLSDWATASVTSLYATFRGSAFDGSIGAWDVSGVLSMKATFYETTAFNADISAWDVSSVTDMENCFGFARYFTRDLGAWDVRAVESMNAMFYSILHLNENPDDDDGATFNHDLNGWDTSAATDFAHLFGYADVFNGDVSAWDTSAVRAMDYTFFAAAAFNGDVGAWDVSAVTSMSGIFGDAAAFDRSLFWCVDESSVAIVDATAGAGCEGSCTLTCAPSPEPTVEPTANRVDRGTFEDALEDALAGGEGTYGPIEDWDTSAIRDMSSAFSGAGAFNGDVSGWDTSAATDMTKMFYEARAFNGDLSAWDVGSVTKLKHLFDGARAFEGGDLSGWDTSSVTRIDFAFANARAFDGNVKDWDTSAVTNAEGAFLGSPFNRNIGDWNVGKVTNMRAMFQDAAEFDKDLPWDTSKCTDMAQMFDGATAFNGDISSWDVDTVATIEGMFQNAEALDRDLGWCLADASVVVTDAFEGAGCEATDCGVSLCAPTPAPSQEYSYSYTEPAWWTNIWSAPKPNDDQV